MPVFTTRLDYNIRKIYLIDPKHILYKINQIRKIRSVSNQFSSSMELGYRLPLQVLGWTLVDAMIEPIIDNKKLYKVEHDYCS